MRRVALILAGGSGERFWPVSTVERPKQLLTLLDPELTLLEQTIDRITPLFGFENIFVVCSTALAATFDHVLPKLRGQLIAEPAKRNTAGAIVWAMAKLSSETNEEISFTILPADHRIEPAEEFHASILAALEISEEGHSLVTLGIKPTRPETGYGYIQRGEPLKGHAYQVKRFTEKPDPAAALQFVEVGTYLWNCGMFFWTSSTFSEEITTASPVHRACLDTITGYLKAKKLSDAETTFVSLPNISIDYALLEKSFNIVVVEANFHWDDVGSWDSLSRFLPNDSSGNVHRGAATFTDAAECIVYNDTESVGVEMFGVEGLVVVVTGTTVLVCTKEKAQEIRRLSAKHGSGS
jgi:mannose-1-phosphate guanylyltransferase